MKNRNSKPYYKYNKIWSLNALDKALGVNKEKLLDIANRAESLYKDSKKVTIKPDGTIRHTKDALPELKGIQQIIKEVFLKKVEYPYYLQGSISSSNVCKRGTYHNAKLHAKSVVVINEDIANFFPSTTTKIVFNIWKKFFGFSNEVASCLTKLTIFNNCLPQGAKTSSYIANLAFWDIEYQLHDVLMCKGYRYSRYVDDIAVSARRKLSREEKQLIISEIYKMLFKKGYRPKRIKHEISNAGDLKQVTKRIVNRKNPTLPRKKRGEIKAIVASCISAYRTMDKSSNEYKRMFNRASGLVGELGYYHPRQSKKLKEQLAKIKPIKYIRGR